MTDTIDFTIYLSYINYGTKAREDAMQTETSRKLRSDLTPEQRKEAERIGSLPAGQRIKTAWSMRVEKFIPSRTQR
jgi:hypothetical protein